MLTPADDTTHRTSAAAPRTEPGAFGDQFRAHQPPHATHPVLAPVQ